MAGHCEDNSADRKKGEFWEKKFCRMALEYGHVFTPHQIGRGRIAACAYSPSGHIILPDITIWSGPGQHHEIKHKNPAKGRRFGLESYRLDSLLVFEQITGEAVYYTIHNWELAGGTDATENRIEDWVTCDASFLQANRGKPELGNSWVNGEKKAVPILYWPVAYFRALAALWRDCVRTASPLGRQERSGGS